MFYTNFSINQSINQHKAVFNEIGWIGGGISKNRGLLLYVIIKLNLKWQTKCK